MLWQSKPQEFWKLNPKSLERLWRSEQKDLADWHRPETACTLLDEVSGMQTRGYKNDASKPEEYWCSSPNKRLGNGRPMPNRLAYYVSGDRHSAKELKLVLNVNSLSTAELAHGALALASIVLTRRALRTELPDEVGMAIFAGKPGKWKAGKNKIAILRDDWENGKGYEVKFIIR